MFNEKPTNTNIKNRKINVIQDKIVDCVNNIHDINNCLN